MSHAELFAAALPPMASIKTYLQCKVQFFAQALIFADLSSDEILSHHARNFHLSCRNDEIVLCRFELCADSTKLHCNPLGEYNKRDCVSRRPNFSYLVNAVEISEISFRRIFSKVFQGSDCIAELVRSNSNLLGKACCGHLSQREFLSSPTSTLGGRKPNRAAQCSDSSNSSDPVGPYRDVHFAPRDAVVTSHSDGCSDSHNCPLIIPSHSASNISWRNRNMPCIGGGK